MFAIKKISGFTVVEILIVFVILGILSAIVIPQFSQASSEARESTLMSNLQKLRSNVELYRIHHNGLLPGEEGTSSDNITVSTNSIRFLVALQGTTNAKGQLGTGPGYEYGPYLKELPANPFSISNASVVEIDGKVGNGDYGWHLTTFGTERGLVQPDDTSTNRFTNQKHTSY